MNTATRLVLTPAPTSDEIGMLLHHLCLTRADMSDRAGAQGEIFVHVTQASGLPESLTRTVASRVITVRKLSGRFPVITEDDLSDLAMQEPAWA